MLPNGLSDPEHIEWGNWGGRFGTSGRGNEYIPTEDWMGNRQDVLYTIHRWRQAYQNSFEARMDWCVKPYEKCNHEPVAVCNGDKTKKVLNINIDQGQNVTLTANGSSDPDGDELSYKWWIYREAGSYWADVPFRGENSIRAGVTVPKKASGKTIHVILEVVDSGAPSLTAYRRAILNVSGDPITAPIEVRPLAEYLSTPVNKLSGPASKMGKWKFYRGINLNGPAITIDDNRWQGDDALDFICNDRAIDSPGVVLRPPTNESRAKMIQSFRWNRRVKIKVTHVLRGNYAVYAYLWEDNNPETFSISLQGEVVEKDYYSGQEGQWRRLGPWITTIADGVISITCSGGVANFSGIEIWQEVKP